MNIQEIFARGMKRLVPELLDNGVAQLELGPGNSPTPKCKYLGLPEWNADSQIMPYHAEVFDVIHAYHFLEHCKNPMFVLLECQRVLKKGGHINIVVPHCKSELAFEDITHVQYFHEKTIPQMIHNKGYGRKNLNFRVHANFLMAVDFRNLSIFTQLIKE